MFYYKVKSSHWPKDLEFRSEIEMPVGQCFRILSSDGGRVYPTLHILHKLGIRLYCVKENLVKKDNVKNILSASKELESPYKEVFYMKTLGDFSYEIIAEVFEKSESWARVTYYRAKQKIIERMNENE